MIIVTKTSRENNFKEIKKIGTKQYKELRNINKNQTYIAQHRLNYIIKTY